MYVPPIICTHQGKRSNECVQKKLFSRSDLSRVEGVDFHPTVPWFLTGLYNHETEAIVNTSDSEVAEVQCAVSDSSQARIGSSLLARMISNYGCSTHEKIAAFEARPDYIRCLTLHPGAASIVLTASGSDDMSMKAWDWDKGWKNILVKARVSASES